VTDGGSNAADDGQQSAQEARDNPSVRTAAPEQAEWNSARSFDVIDAIPPSQRGGDRRGPEEPPSADGPGAWPRDDDAAEQVRQPLDSVVVEAAPEPPEPGATSGALGPSAGPREGDDDGAGADGRPTGSRGDDPRPGGDREPGSDTAPAGVPQDAPEPDSAAVAQPRWEADQQEDPRTRTDPPPAPAQDARLLDEESTRALLFVRSLAGVEHGTSKIQPERMRDLFATFPREVTDKLVTQAPDLIGNLPGAPLELRAAANTLRIRHELDSQPTLPPDVRRTEMLGQLLTPLVTNTWKPDGTTQTVEVPRQVIHFDPRGPGEAVEVIGDLRTAEKVAVFIPGMRTGLHNYAKFLDDVLHVRAAAGEENIAYVVWQGYHAPRGSGALSSDWAQKGARALLDTRHELGLLIPPGAEVVFGAHSYGTVVTGQAIAMGLTGDRFLFMGSPGVDWNIERLSDLDPAGPMRAWAMRAPGDFVPPTVWHGTPPDRWPDVGVLPTQGPNEAIRGHFSYYQAGSQSLTNVVDVITDHPRLADPAPHAPEVVQGAGFLESGATVVGQAKSAVRGLLPRDADAPTGFGRAPGLREVDVAVAPDVNVAADLARIWDGDATVDMRSRLCDVEGRVYAMKDGRWFPVAGEGILQVTREHRLGFAVLDQAAGNPERAERLMDQHGVSPQVREDLRPWFPARGPSS
jgi:hypothetical protein